MAALKCVDDCSDTDHLVRASYNATRRNGHWIFHLFIYALICSTAASEDSPLSSYYYDDDELPIYPEEESSPACVLTFSLIFGFFIILFCTVLGYFSFMEDALMRQYIKKGEVIKGDVMKAEFARGGGQVGACSNKRAIAEYNIFVEYPRELSTNYEVRIRKQMKAKETDFVRRPLPGSNAMLQSLKTQEEDENDNIGAKKSEEVECDGYIDIGPADPSLKAGLGQANTIELYILSDYPISALPRRQVEGRCSWRHRLATFALIVVLLALAVFCTRFAAEALVYITGAAEESIDLYSISLFAALLIVQVPLVHYCMRNMFRNILLVEYLESGEYVTIHRDDSTLSTKDSYLMSPSLSPVIGFDIRESGEWK